MQFEVYMDNGGRFHWRLVGDDGTAVAVSAADFASEQTARESADDTRALIGAAEPRR